MASFFEMAASNCCWKQKVYYLLLRTKKENGLVWFQRLVLLLLLQVEAGSEDGLWWGGCSCRCLTRSWSCCRLHCWTGGSGGSSSSRETFLRLKGCCGGEGFRVVNNFNLTICKWPRTRIGKGRRKRLQRRPHFNSMRYCYSTIVAALLFDIKRQILSWQNRRNMTICSATFWKV